MSPVLDLYNSEIISYDISNRPTLNLALNPVRTPLSLAEKHNLYRTSIHSDQGWHYQHKNYRNTIRRHKTFQSMSRKGNCLDNAPIENFFGLLKQEMYYGEKLVSYEELKSRMDPYIHYYNTKRIKTKLVALSPVQYWEKLANRLHDTFIKLTPTFGGIITTLSNFFVFYSLNSKVYFLKV